MLLKCTYWSTTPRYQYYMLQFTFDFLYLTEGKEKQKMGNIPDRVAVGLRGWLNQCSVIRNVVPVRKPSLTVTPEFPQVVIGINVGSSEVVLAFFCH